MLPAELICFATTLFLALAALISWKRRRDLVQARLTKGLRGYVAAVEPTVQADELHVEHHREQLIVA